MEWRVASVADFGEGNLLSVRAGLTRIVLCRVSDSTISALLDRCSHANVRLSGGRIVAGELECPAHRGRFDCRTGEPRGEPAVVGVRSFAVRLSNGDIFVMVP